MHSIYIFILKYSEHTHTQTQTLGTIYERVVWHCMAEANRTQKGTQTGCRLEATHIAARNSNRHADNQIQIQLDCYYVGGTFAMTITTYSAIHAVARLFQRICLAIAFSFAFVRARSNKHAYLRICGGLIITDLKMSFAKHWTVPFLRDYSEIASISECKYGQNISF